MLNKTSLETIRTSALTELAAVRAQPKPSYSIDGQAVHWNDYCNSLQQTIDWCNQHLAALEPYEIQSQAVT